MTTHQCKKVRRHLLSFLDDEITPNLKTFLSNHIKKCEGCSRELSSLNAMKEALRSRQIIEPSEDFEERFFKKVSLLQEEKVSAFQRISELLPVRLEVSLSLSILGVALGILAQGLLWHDPEEGTKAYFRSIGIQRMAELSEGTLTETYYKLLSKR